MNPNYTDITFIVDKSGSMGPLRNDTIGGINTFLADQKKLTEGKTVLTMIQFSTSSEVTINKSDIILVDPLGLEDYVTGGGTALLDAVGDAIDKAGKRFRSMREAQRPSKVLFVIITDGEENSSTRFSLDQIKNMITEQQDSYKWQFVFLGANQDSFQSAHSFGIYAHNTSNYHNTSVGVCNMYGSLSSNVMSFRADTAEKVLCRSFWQAPVDGVDNSHSTGTGSKP